MKEYIQFLRGHVREVGFGFAFTFFSSLGQTFLISLYVPHILAELNLTNSLFGTLYAAATITSSLLLMSFGGRIDRLPLRQYIYRTLIVLAAASLALGLVHSPILLPPALLGLRFAGQGAMSHISKTVIGRRFRRNRGKALSLSALGHSVGEMVFPVLITLLIPLLGWRMSLAVNGMALILVMVPLLELLRFDEIESASKRRSSVSEGAGHPVALGERGASPATSRWEIVRGSTFWTLMPVLMILSAVTTGVFFYQLVMAETRGWSVELYSAMFSGYAVTRFVFGLYGGALVDRFSARRLFPLHFIPLIIGLVVLALSPVAWGGAFFLVMAGISMGCSSPIKTAIMAETHGVDNLGEVRSVYTAFAVFGTALGPVLFGQLLDLGFAFGSIFLIAALLMAAAVLPSFRVPAPQRSV